MEAPNLLHELIWISSPPPHFFPELESLSKWDHETSPLIFSWMITLCFVFMLRLRSSSYMAAHFEATEWYGISLSLYIDIFLEIQRPQVIRSGIDLCFSSWQLFHQFCEDSFPEFVLQFWIKLIRFLNSMLAYLLYEQWINKWGTNSIGFLQREHHPIPSFFIFVYCPN